MDRCCKKSGIKQIRLPDLRNSHVSLLITIGFSVVDIAESVGHESIKITDRYAHMLPSKDTDIANHLDSSKGGINMSKRNLDQKGKLRGKLVSFRVSPEEWKMLDRKVVLSGHTKQNYTISCILERKLLFMEIRMYLEIK